MSTVGEIKYLVVSEHVIRSSQAMVDGHEWPRMRPEGSKDSEPEWELLVWKEHGSCLKENSQGSVHRVPCACVELVPAFIELSL